MAVPVLTAEALCLETVMKVNRPMAIRMSSILPCMVDYSVSTR